MKVLEHGNFYEENRIIDCTCGCKFEYEMTDVTTVASLATFASTAIYERYVRCPECDAKINLGTTIHGETRKYCG